MYFKTSDWSDETLQDKCSEFAKKIQPNQSENPKVSVYFCAHNEEDYLLPTLHSYAQIHSKIPYEIIGVTNASTDRTAMILQESGIRVVTENKKGTSYARQAGLEALRGSIAIEGSADTLIHRDWIEKHYAAYGVDEVVQAYGPIVYQDAHRTFLIARTIFRTLRGMGNILGILPLVVGGPNRSYRIDIAKKVGGFVPGVDLGEDILISSKIGAQGITKKITGPGATVLTDGRRFRTRKQVMALIQKRLIQMRQYRQELHAGVSFSDIRE